MLGICKELQGIIRYHLEYQHLPRMLRDSLGFRDPGQRARWPLWSPCVAMSGVRSELYLPALGVRCDVQENPSDPE